MKLKYFNLAKRLSFKSDHSQHKIGGVLVKKSKIISVGFNKLKTHTKSNTPHKSIHCELDVILGCNIEDTIGSDLYLYRQHKDGHLASSKPCAYCQQLISKAGIRNVFYTDNGEFKELK